MIAAVLALSSCSPNPAATIQVSEPAVTGAPSAPTASEPAPSVSAAIEPAQSGKVINIYGATGRMLGIVRKFNELHPDFKYTINLIPETADSNNVVNPESELDTMLASSVAPDMYIVEVWYAVKYMQGDMSGYAMPYEDLGIDVRKKTESAGIARFIVDTGTRPSDGKVVGLTYESTAGAFIYRRSIAKDTWGTDDPSVIATKIGPGWENFFKAGEELKQKGYAIVSGSGNIWPAVENSADKGWITGGKLYIDPKREAFLDYSKELTGKGYSNGNDAFIKEWRNDMADGGEREVFGFFASAWMINNDIARNCGDTKGDWVICEPPVACYWRMPYTWVLASKELQNDPEKKAAVAELLEWMTLDCTEKGLQYYLANGTLYDRASAKTAVASRTVMEMSDGTTALLDGQDIFDVFIQANESVKSGNITEYDNTIEHMWDTQVLRYTNGECTREEAITAFKQDVKEQLGFDAW